jgi:26S proteasome regulatory subunit N1
MGPGMMSAAASLGLSLLWDTDVGLSHVDKYTYSSGEHIKVEHCGLQKLTES